MIMDYGLLLIGIALLLVSYLVAVKKQTWLLAGFNEKMIKNKSLLGTVTGGVFFLPLGLLAIINSIIDYPHEIKILIIAMFVLLTIVYVFINRKLLD
ncbi:phosphate starvation-inducible membrane PsiE [Bacillus sp. SORGH_AS 510]|nr:phosphate starvation-inducible membrane PsiE [Bacillus sp. SORGH_AS_0510]